MRNLQDDGRAGESRQCAKMRGMSKKWERQGVKKNELGKQVDRDGYAIVSTVVHRLVVRDLIERLNGSELPRSRAGVRHLMKDPWVAQLAAREEIIGIAREIVGSKAWPFGATLFDKSPSSNWLVAWHQDSSVWRHKEAWLSQDRL